MLEGQCGERCLREEFLYRRMLLAAAGFAGRISSPNASPIQGDLVIGDPDTQPAMLAPAQTRRGLFSQTELAEDGIQQVFRGGFADNLTHRIGGKA